MQQPMFNLKDNAKISKLPVIRNFRKIIETRTIEHMHKELYEFLYLHCGFIAHFDINGFKSTYSQPEDFEGIFIRHFDTDHRYFDGAYRCHEEQYKSTGFTKAQIKKEFFHIVDHHKDSINSWAEQKHRDEKNAVYLRLKKEFEGGE